MTKTGRLTIPADVRKEMGLTEESLLEIEVDRENDVIHLRPKATIPR
ncbi:MAG: AbrB/MazE/SpoVT family DNA-binding domain-containing protein, partial [Tepidiformaceae bacterium]